MKRTIQVRISRGENQFVAECLDLPVVTQARTSKEHANNGDRRERSSWSVDGPRRSLFALEELTENIREAVGLHLEGEDLAALGLATTPTILATLELEAVA